MEFARNGDLYDYIQERKAKYTPFPEDHIMAMFTQIMLALDFLHARHILHRDMKTKNVFLDGDLPSLVKGVHKVPFVKLGDFGISKILDRTGELAKTQIGTPYYLSPEICENKPYGAKSDVWAAGCILFELVTFSVPFQGRDLVALTRAIMASPLPKLPSSYPASGVVAKLINAIMVRNVAKRPSTSDILANPAVASMSMEVMGIIKPGTAPPVAQASPAPAAAANLQAPAPSSAKVSSHDKLNFFFIHSSRHLRPIP
jgi:NIMA (never in mitosis gene a)-related kinase